MSELEKYISERKDAFENSEPQDGHTERFLLRLEKYERDVKKPITLFWRIAAAAIVLVVVSLSIWLPKPNTPADVQYGSLSLSDVSSEFADVEKYYKSKLALEYEKINDLSKSDPEVASYLAELKDLSALYDTLEHRLYESGTHEKVITAMIENFRLRLELIEKLEKSKLNKQ